MELSRIRSSVVADVPGPARAGDRTQKITVLYSGNADFARVQFAAEAPLLHLVMDVEALGAASGSAAGDRPAIDVAFIDCGSPGVNAASLVEELRRRQPGLPIVIALDPGVDDAARLALDLQADDYTVKSPGWLSRLQVRLAMVVARQRRARQLEAVRAIEQRLRSIVESSPVCLARVDRIGTILAINDAARAMIGATEPADVLRKSIVAFVTPDDQEAARRFIDMACSEQAGSFEFSLTTAPSGTRRVEASAIKLPSAANVEATAALVLREAGSAHLDQSVVDAAVAEATGNLSAQAAQLASENEQVQQELGALQERHRQLTQDRDRALADADRAGAAETMLAEKLRHLELEAARVQRERDELRRVVEEHRSTYASELASTASARDDLLRSLEEAEAGRRLLEAERDGLQTAAEERRLRYEAEIASAMFSRADLEGRLRSAEAAAKRAAEEARASVAVQLTELEARWRQLEAERDALLHTIDARGREHQAEVATLASARADAQQQVADLERQLRSAEAEATRAAEETRTSAALQLSELEARWRQLETERDAIREAAETRGRDHQAEIASLAAARTEVQQHVADLEGRLRSAEAGAQRAFDEAVRANEAGLQELEGRWRQLETERDALQEAAEARARDHQAEIAALVAARTEAQQRFSDVEERLRSAEAGAKRALDDVVAASAAQLQKLETRGRQFETERDALREAAETEGREHQDAIAALAGARAEAQARVADLEGQLRTAEAVAKRTTDEAVAAMAVQLTELEAQGRQLEVERDALREAVATSAREHQAEAAALSGARTEAQGRVAELEGQLRAAEAAAKRATDEAVAVMAAQLTELDARRRQLEAERNALRDAAETRGQEHRAAIAALAVARADAQLRVADLEGQLRSAEAGAKRAVGEAVAAAAVQLQELEARWRQLEAERDALRKAVETLEQEHQAKLAELAAVHAEAQARVTDLEGRLRSTEAVAKRAADEAAASTAKRLQQLEARCRQLEGECEARREAEETLACQHRAEIADVVAGRAVVERKVAELEARARVALEAQDLSARQLAQWKLGSQQLDGERTKLEARVEELERTLMRAVTERDGLRVTLGGVHERHARALADEISNRRVLELRVQRAGERLEQMLEMARAEFAQLAARARDGSEPEPPSRSSAGAHATASVSAGGAG